MEKYYLFKVDESGRVWVEPPEGECAWCDLKERHRHSAVDFVTEDWAYATPETVVEILEPDL